MLHIARCVLNVCAAYHEPTVRIFNPQAIREGKACGLAFQNLPSADNIGYVIPTPIIRRDARAFSTGICVVASSCLVLVMNIARVREIPALGSSAQALPRRRGVDGKPRRILPPRGPLPGD